MAMVRTSAPSSYRLSSDSSVDDGRFLPGTLLAERYRITALIGCGGMGEVYRATDLKLAQPVALKFLPEALSREVQALQRFYNEVRVAARQISHHNVCRVYDIGETEGMAYISMEFIKGEDLGSLLRRIGRLPTDKALQMARQFCAGLAAAHEKGVLHRDLKPANVMIDGDGAIIWELCWGYARRWAAWRSVWWWPRRLRWCVSSRSFLFRLLLRRDWLTALAYIIFFSVVGASSGEGNRGIVIVFGLLGNALFTGVLLRYGLLTNMVMIFTSYLGREFPITLDMGSWRGDLTLLVVAILGGIGIYTFRIALAHRKVFSAIGG